MKSDRSASLLPSENELRLDSSTTVLEQFSDGTITPPSTLEIISVLPSESQHFLDLPYTDTTMKINSLNLVNHFPPRFWSKKQFSPITFTRRYLKHTKTSLKRTIS